MQPQPAPRLMPEASALSDSAELLMTLSLSGFLFMQLKASLRSGQNFEVSDCDLWSTWSVFHSSRPVGGRYGLMTRNQIYNGGSCHWFVSCGCPRLDIPMRSAAG